MPRRRPPGAGPALGTKLLTLLFVLPWLSTAAQQQQPQGVQHGARGRSPREPSNGVHTLLPPSQHHHHHHHHDQGSDKPAADRLDNAAARPQYYTPGNAPHELAVTTVSSAPAVSAVRAHPGRNAASSDGLTRPSARSIRDWNLEDFVLLATVDGHIHARNRYTGDQIWELDVGKPMLETIYNTRNDSSPTEGWREKPFIWIVEPKEDGALYILSPGPYPVLQSLGLTVKQLTDDLNPYSSDDPPVVYTCEKRSLMLVVDARTGRVTKSFSPSGSMNMQDPESCHTQAPEYFTNDRNECRGYFNLGQTEYTVSIHNKNTGEHICTIKYSEWTSNNRDRDLQDQYHQPMDQLYLSSRYNGEVIAFDHKRSNWEKNSVYRKDMEYPVARVFDVASRADDEDPEPALVLLPQPPGRGILPDKIKHVWLNTTDGGSWYALSEANYPSVTDSAPQASCYKYHDYTRESSHVLPERKGLVGVHVLDYRKEAPQTFHALPAPKPSNNVDNDVSIPPEIPRPVPTWPTLDPPPQNMIEHRSIRWTFLPVLVALAVCALTYSRQNASIKMWISKNFTKSGKAEPFKATPTEAELLVATETKEEGPAAEIKSEEPALAEPTLAEAPPTPIDSEKKKVTFDLPVDEEDDLSPLSRTTTVDEASVKETASEAAENGLAAEDAKTNDAEDSPQDGPQDATAPLTPKKKKTHRGKRGGQKGRNRKPKEGDEIDQIVDAAKQLIPAPSMHPDETTVVNGDDVQDVTNIKKIGKLTIDFDRVLGNGSGGTFVFEGKWNDRDVAVKRMLPQYFGLAEQEVKLLQESDLHPNVIRYFDDEKDENFLYIAVELCQASLFDLYRDGRPGDDLTETQLRLVNEINRNVSRALYQLAEGVHHLHSLRIIHRDIKPQNILIAYPQRNQRNGPRLVISDFGLCKTLPDNMSTLIGTTGNAGTVGWKAPELILQPRDISFGSSTGHSRESSNSTDPVSQGVKRAVDIFSLGCVFYYVLTNGSHPFDDDEGWAQMREYNIKKNKASFEQLSLGDDSEEPIHLISAMLANRPEDRPTAAQVMNHPFFWSAEKRLSFLCDCSDHWEREPRDPPSEHLSILENYSYDVLDKKRDFLAKLDRGFIASLGKQRKYTGDRMLDLLRALRNKKNHYEDMDEVVKAKVGPLPHGYLRYWTVKFPKLLMSCYECVVECGLQEEPRFRVYFEGAN